MRGPLSPQACRKLLRRRGFARNLPLFIERIDLGGTMNPHRILKTEHPNSCTKFRAIAVRTVGQHDLAWHLVLPSTLDEVQCDLRLGAEHDFVGDFGFFASL